MFWFIYPKPWFGLFIAYTKKRIQNINYLSFHLIISPHLTHKSILNSLIQQPHLLSKLLLNQLFIPGLPTIPITHRLQILQTQSLGLSPLPQRWILLLLHIIQLFKSLLLVLFTRHKLICNLSSQWLKWLVSSEWSVMWAEDVHTLAQLGHLLV